MKTKERGRTAPVFGWLSAFSTHLQENPIKARHMSNSVTNPSSKPTSFFNPKIHLVWGSVFVAFGLLGLWAYKSSIDGVIKGGKEAKDAAIDALEKANKIAADNTKGIHDAVVSDLEKAHDVTKKDLGDLAGKVEAWSKAAAEEAKAIAAKFYQGTITETFKSESPIFELIKVGRLEVAVAKSTESFERKTEQTAVWKTINLGATVSEIKVPATYRYHLDLAEDWKIEIKDKCCVVHAPSLKPSLPVAFQTDKMEKYSQTGWGRFDGAEQLDELEKQITPRLNKRASEPGHMKAAQREARDVVARFVRTWLLSSGQWKNDRFTSITVLFANEDPSAVSAQPTLTIDTLP